MVAADLDMHQLILNSDSQKSVSFNKSHEIFCFVFLKIKYETNL